MAAIALSEVTVGKRFRKELGDLTELKQSLTDRGQLQEIVVDSDKRLIAGYRRLKAAKELGWSTIRVYVAKNIADALAKIQAERDENVCRKSFTPSEAVAMGEAIEEFEKREAAKRQKEHGGTAPGRKKNTSAESSEVSKPRETREVVAASVAALQGRQRASTGGMRIDEVKPVEPFHH